MKSMLLKFRGVLLLLTSMLICGQAHPSELKSLRLFYDLPLEKMPKSDSHAKSTPPTRKPVLPSSRAGASVHKLAYQYNGFINTSHGKHYFINGSRLAQSDVLMLVAVGLDGRKLKIKTHSGHVFEISIGQTVSIAKADIQRK